MSKIEKKRLKVYLAKPRGFCAGVDRAIKIVEQTIIRYGKPVYVRHEIVHNKYVVDNLKSKGAIFIEEIDEIPLEDRDRALIFSAHGVAKNVPKNASDLNIFYIDATCPLVTKVHNEVINLCKLGYEILLIGHSGHPEVVGTMGQLPKGSVTLIENVEDAKKIEVSKQDKLAYVTQTTLSIYDTQAVVDILKSRFPKLTSPKKSDICFATMNRQRAVEEIAKNCELIYIVGAPNSSNSKRLVEIAMKKGDVQSKLVEGADDIIWDDLEGVDVIGLSAGASAPEILVEQVIDKLRKRYDIEIENVITVEEVVEFKLPTLLCENNTKSL